MDIDEAYSYFTSKMRQRECDVFMSHVLGGESLASIAKYMDITRQRCHQILQSAINHIPLNIEIFNELVSLHPSVTDMRSDMEFVNIIAEKHGKDAVYVPIMDLYTKSESFDFLNKMMVDIAYNYRVKGIVSIGSQDVMNDSSMRLFIESLANKLGGHIAQCDSVNYVIRESQRTERQIMKAISTCRVIDIDHLYQIYTHHANRPCIKSQPLDMDTFRALIYFADSRWNFKIENGIAIANGDINCAEYLSKSEYCIYQYLEEHGQSDLKSIKLHSGSHGISAAQTMKVLRYAPFINRHDGLFSNIKPLNLKG